MLLNVNTDPEDNSSCSLYYNEQQGWLEAIWKGYVDPTEAMHGAEAYLRHAAHTPCAFLLNDNSRLTGPWFDSLDWLADVWVPQAQRLGLRCVAHIVQTDRHSDSITNRLPVHLPFELQIFQDGADARDWLQQFRQQQVVQR